MQDSVVQVRVAKLAMAKHLVGDFFTIEHIFPTQMIEMDSYQELLALPGVFMLTWDNCEYYEVYRHRQVLITNHPDFANLSRDCDKMHTHVPITRRTGSLLHRCRRLRRSFAKLMRDCYGMLS